MRKRVFRSTSVPTADLPFLPITKSPSQWPGTARSSTSAGRSLIMTIPWILPCVTVRLRHSALPDDYRIEPTEQLVEVQAGEREHIEFQLISVTRTIRFQDDGLGTPLRPGD